MFSARHRLTSLIEPADGEAGVRVCYTVSMRTRDNMRANLINLNQHEVDLPRGYQIGKALAVEET